MMEVIGNLSEDDLSADELDILEELNQFEALYYNLKERLRLISWQQYNRWSAGGYLIDDDIMSMYPVLRTAIEEAISAAVRARSAQELRERFKDGQRVRLAGIIEDGVIQSEELGTIVDPDNVGPLNGTICVEVDEPLHEHDDMMREVPIEQVELI